MACIRVPGVPLISTYVLVVMPPRSSALRLIERVLSICMRCPSNTLAVLWGQWWCLLYRRQLRLRVASSGNQSPLQDIPLYPCFEDTKSQHLSVFLVKVVWGPPNGLPLPVSTSEGHLRVTYLADAVFQIMTRSPAWPPRPEETAGTLQ